jgi:2-succinyl-6-hydroxy-2,4-cyclohexadiene-1-carboxylate synthase
MSSHKKSDIRVHALHGFLGQPSDWAMFDFIDHTIELNHSELDFITWCQRYNDCRVSHAANKNILLGYSLGGRLAMHLLLSAPTLWDAAIFVSAHPGLDSDHARASRLLSDQKWAMRFLEDPWDELMCAWNENSVFGGFPSLPRSERNYDRNILAQQLTLWSLGNQEFLLERLKELAMPTLYIVGEQDKAYLGIAEKFKEFSKVSIIPDAAHRVPWDQPEKFTTQINQFLMDIS